jgi:hypothetical protein
MRGREKQDGGGSSHDVGGRISDWLEGVLEETAELEPPVEIVVSHAAVDQHRRVIRSFQISNLPVPAPEVYKLVDAIGAAISMDAEDLGGFQRYQLVMRCRDREVGSTTIRYAMDAMPSAIDSEPANARGLVAQAQRHTEASVRMLVQGNGALLGAFQKRLNEQDALIERLYGRWIESMETKEQFVSERAALAIEADERKLENELRGAREMAEIERNKLLWGEGLSMAKFGLSKLGEYMGAKSGSVAAPDEAAEMAYFATITDQQIEQVRRRAPPGDFEAFMAKVQRARAAVSPEPTASRPPVAESSPAQSSPPPRTAMPLEGDAKVGAAQLLARDLLPTVTARHLARKPLIDPATDDFAYYQLLRRLVASVTEEEMEFILGALPDDQRAATLALLDLMKLKVGAAGATEVP